MAYVEEEAEGSPADFARFLFDRHQTPPGEIVYYDEAFRDVNVYFKALCEIYVYGIKLYNGLELGDPLPDIDALDPQTHAFVAQRFETHLKLRIIMTRARGIPGGAGPNIWEHGHTLEQCWYHNTVRGISLRIESVRGRSAGSGPPLRQCA